MTFISLHSDNPNFSFIVKKNPFSLPFCKNLKNGLVWGHYSETISPEINSTTNTTNITNVDNQSETNTSNIDNELKNTIDETNANANASLKKSNSKFIYNIHFQELNEIVEANSFNDKSFNYLNKEYFCHPKAYLNCLDKALNTICNKEDERDLPTYNNEICLHYFQIGNFKISQIFINHLTLKGYKFELKSLVNPLANNPLANNSSTNSSTNVSTYSSSPVENELSATPNNRVDNPHINKYSSNLYSIKISKSNSTIHELLNITRLFCIYSTSQRDKSSFKFNIDFLKKYSTFINKLDFPYFLRYLFSRDLLYNKSSFEACVPLLNNNSIYLTRGNTQLQRYLFIRNKLNLNTDILDIGCGDGFYLFNIYKDSKFDWTYHAIDIDETKLEYIEDQIEEERYKSNNGINSRSSINSDFQTQSNSQTRVNSQTLSNSSIDYKIKFYSNLKEYIAKTKNSLNSKVEIILSEVIEHCSEIDSINLIRDILDNVEFNQLIITTPNKDFNIHYLMEKTELRDIDHQWEKNKEQFLTYINLILEQELSSVITSTNNRATSDKTSVSNVDSSINTDSETNPKTDSKTFIKYSDLFSFEYFYIGDQVDNISTTQGVIIKPKINLENKTEMRISEEINSINTSNDIESNTESNTNSNTENHTESHTENSTANLELGSSSGLNKRAIICIGCSGSGKSTFARQLCKDDPTFVELNRDNTRLELGYFKGEEINWNKYPKANKNPRLYQEYESKVSEINKEKLLKYSIENKNVIISDTNLDIKFREALIKDLIQKGYRVETKIFDLNFTTLSERNLSRIGSVPEHILLKQYINFQRDINNIEIYKPKVHEPEVHKPEVHKPEVHKPEVHEPEINKPEINKSEANKSEVNKPEVHTAHKPNKTLPEAYIVDLDGTIFKMGNRSPFDFTKVLEDKPIIPVINIVKGLYNLGFNIIFLSGREDSCKEDSIACIKRDLGIDLLYDKQCSIYMRNTGDSRRDSIIKMELFNTFIRDKYRVLAAIDDRIQVLYETWNVLGIPTINVGDPTKNF